MRSLNIIFRQLPYNHYTISKLIALIESFFDSSEVKVHIIKNLNEFPEMLSANRGSINLICYSFMTPFVDKIRDEINLLKPVLSESDFLLAGGAHPAADPEGCLSIGFDTVFTGESEKTFSIYLENILGGNIPSRGNVINSTDCGFVRLDDYPPFSFNLNYIAPIELTRGCEKNCAFCQASFLFGRKIRSRSINGLKDIFLSLKERNRRKLFFITSNMLAYKSECCSSVRESLEKLCLLALEHGLDHIHLGSFPSEIRPECLNEDLIAVLSKYCVNRNISIGAQSGSERILKKLRRGHTVEHVKKAALLCREFKFLPVIDFIFGFPGESKDDVQQSLELIDWLMYHTNAKIHVHYFMPLPLTPLWGESPSALTHKVKNRIDHLLRHGRASGDIWWQEKVSNKILNMKSERLIFV